MTDANTERARFTIPVMERSIIIFLGGTTMENEILNNKTIETVEAVVKPAKGFKVVMGVGITALVGYAAYKFVVKPAVAKVKAKNAVKIENETAEIEVEEMSA